MTRAARRRPRALAVLALPALILPALPSRPVLATVVPRLGLEEITGAAGVIVLGKVEKTEAAWSDDGRIIVTRVEIAVERSLKGGPRARVTFEVPGGKVGDQTLVASGAPVFRSGERVVLFLAAVGVHPPGAVPGEPRLGVVGWNQGALAVRRDPATGSDTVRLHVGGTVALDREGRPVQGGAGGGPWELGRFLAEVETIISAKAPPGGER